MKKGMEKGKYGYDIFGNNIRLYYPIGLENKRGLRAYDFARFVMFWVDIPKSNKRSTDSYRAKVFMKKHCIYCQEVFDTCELHHFPDGRFGYVPKNIHKLARHIGYFYFLKLSQTS